LSPDSRSATAHSAEPVPASSAAGRAPRRTGLGALLVLLLLVLATALRVERAFADPNFDAADDRGMLKSDPALLYYVTERILAADGWAPDDFRADPRIQWPETTDVPAEFTVGQEFLVAWAYLLVGGGAPLHAFAVRVMALVASLAVLGVYGAVLARTRSVPWALFAALLFSLLPASYRTIGFVLVREDLSLPLFALHLGLLARARRVGSARAWLLAGLALAAALATWHAMSFVVLLEALALLGVALWSGASPFAARPARAVLVVPVLAAVLVPALRASGLLLSPAFAIAGALLLAALALERVPRARGRPRATIGLALAATAAAVLLVRLAAPDPGSYAHVHEVLLAKLVHLGRLPADPNELSFDARLLWQGPFVTLAPRDAVALGGVALVLGAPAALALLLRSDPGDRFLGLLALAALPAAWLVERAFVVAACLLPIALAVALAEAGRRLGRRTLAVGALAAAALAVQLSLFASFASGLRLAWYTPPGRQSEIAALVEWIGANVPSDEAIVGDFVNSTAILAHAGNPIVLQPKYETRRARERARAFVTTWFHGTPAELRRLVRERFQARWLLVDRYTLGRLSRYLGGLPEDGPPPAPGTPAAAFQSQDDAVLRGVPGFTLVYRSPPDVLQADGSPYDLFRLYRVE